MNPRFQDTATAYRMHRSVTNEAEAIAAAITQYVADDFALIRNRLRVLDGGTGDGQVLKGVIERLLQNHRGRACEMVLKEHDFHHIEALLQNIAPLLRSFPHLALFVTNRTFRQLPEFPEDLCPENTVCFDEIAGYRMLAMAGTASLIRQDDSPLYSFPGIEKKRETRQETDFSFMPSSGLWNGEQMMIRREPSPLVEPTLKALGDEIRAREIYDELAAAAGGTGKHFTVTVGRQERGAAILAESRDFFWDLAIVSHAFNRDKDPGWICRNLLGPLCEGLSIGGVLVNVHAADGGQVSELKREIFGDEFSFHAAPHTLAEALAVALETEQFHVLPCKALFCQAHITADVFASLEPWKREMVLHQIAVSVGYHLQIPEEAWVPRSAAIEAKIQQLLERDGRLVYALNIAGVKRRE